MLSPWALGCRSGATELVSKECGVAIMMPGSPAYEPHNFVVEGETLTNHRSRVLKDRITYGFVCTPAPGLGDGQTPQQLLESAKHGWLTGRDKRLIGEHYVVLHGHRGLELVMAMTASGETLRNRIFVFPNLAVNVSVLGSEADVALPVADQFLDSLRFLPISDTRPIL